MKQIMCVLLCAALGAPLQADTSALYRMRRDHTETIHTVRIVVAADTGAVTITSTADGEERTVIADKTLATCSFVYHRPAAGTSYQAVREGQSILVQGTLRHRACRRKFALGSGPWYQAIESALERFTQTEARTMKFWLINADECELVEMEATRERVETVSVNGQAVRAVRVKVNLPGLASLFWRADYWFREKDGIYVRYETVEGPGGPRLTVELLSENQ
jgi:hypothetical protein